jgi:hypothetical protein
MNRLILMLALLAAPLMAQEEEPAETGQPTPTQPKSQTAKMEKLLDQITIDMKGVELTPEELDRIMAKLREAFGKLDAPPTSLDATFTPAKSLVLRSGQDSETMQGSWSDEDGSKGTYTLTSLGKGRYKLAASKVGKEGAKTEYKDEGTLAELRKKYSFLKQFAVFRFKQPTTQGGFSLPAQRYEVNRFPTWTVGVNTRPEIKFIKSLGVTVRRPSKELEYHLKLPTETTWIVEKVVPHAKKHGLRKLDLLTEADGEDLTDLKTLVGAKKVLVAFRRGKSMRIALQDESEK